MAGTFAYTEATNILEVTDGTSGAPATFNDMYTADQAGTGTFLLPAGPITDALDYAVRPTDSIAIFLKIIVGGGKTVEEDYVFLTGTDWRGAAQTESIDVSAGDGSYTTTKYWASLDDPNGIDCSDNAAGGGTAWADGTLAVTQDIWGVVWEYVADAQYKIDCCIDFGDGSTSTYFTTINEQVYFKGCHPAVETAATFTMGEKQGDYGINGSIFFVEETANWDFVASGNAPTVNMYNSRIHLISNDACSFYDGTLTFIDAEMSGYNREFSSTAFYFIANIDSYSFLNTKFRNLYQVGMYKTPASAVGIHCHYQKYGILARYSPTFEKILFTEMVFRDLSGSASIATDAIIKDPIEPIGKVWVAKSDSTYIEQYTCNIHIADKEGGDISGVTVQCQGSGNIVSNDAGGTFYECIVAHTSGVFADDVTAGKWSQVTAAKAAAAACTGAAENGEWITGVDYTASASEFSVATDANGDIAEQTIDHWKKSTTSQALHTYSPHEFTFTKAGFEPYIKKNITVDDPIVWEVMLDGATGAWSHKWR